MKLSLSKEHLIKYVLSHLNTFCPDGKTVHEKDISGVSERVFARIEHCFSKVNNRYFFDGSDVHFNHLHGDQYAAFLYFYSNTLFQEGAAADLCAKFFILNKALHGIDAYYEVELPSVFLFVHPFGTVLGRAKYSDYLVVYQGIGVGSNKGVYPRLGEFVSLHPGSSILGNCTVGNNCKISANSTLMDRDLGDNSVFIGSSIESMIRKSDKKLSIWRT